MKAKEIKGDVIIGWCLRYSGKYP